MLHNKNYKQLIMFIKVQKVSRSLPAYVGYQVAHLLGIGKVIGSMLSPNRVIEKDVVPTATMVDA